MDEQEILDTLGLAGNLETARLMEQVAARDTAAALDTLARLYANGKDVGSVLGELSALARDLLLRKTAPQGGAALLTGGYDEATMRALGEQFTAQRLLQTLTVLQSACADLARSSNRRTDAELCLIRLCDETLDQSFPGLAARIARLEERLAQGVSAPPTPAPAQASPRPAPQSRPAPAASAAPEPEDTPPWEEERPPLPEEPPEDRTYVDEEPPVPAQPKEVRPAPAPSPAPSAGGDQAFWPSFVAGLKGKVPPSVVPYLNNPAKVTGVWQNGRLTLWVDSEFTRSMLNKPAVLEGLTQAAAAAFGGEPRVSVVTGKAPAPQPAAPAASAPASPSEPDALDELLAFGEQFDNIIIQ